LLNDCAGLVQKERETKAAKSRKMAF